MSDGLGPWGNSGGGTEPSGRRNLLWLALIVGGALGIWELTRLFPNALADPADQAYFARLCVMLILVASSIAFARRFTARESIRNTVVWLGIIAVLAFGYAFYHQIADATSDMRSEFVPGYPAEAGPNVMVFTENRDGGFSVIGAVNGTTVEFMVDTGASDIVLAPSDARRIGIDVDALQFTSRYETANGEGRGASVIVGKLQVGPVTLLNVPVAVNGAPMRSSLLGMAFLRRMKSFEMKGRKLYLRWR